ncbi:DUF4226 domain-containing protein [Mycobacterium sp. DSM 3803]|nr:DUF4226 domain-containing protein [Mycobacterium sp. DSM 3803]
MAVGFDQGLSDSVDNVMKLVGAAGNVFAPPAAPVFGPGGFPQSPSNGADEDGGGGSGGGGDTTYPLPPGHGPISTPPPAGPGAGGMPNGAGNAGQEYNGSNHGVELTDQKLAQTLKDIFASNQASYDKVMSILKEIEDKQQQMGPEALNTPGGLLTFQKFVDDKLAEVQKVLDEAHVDTAKQSEVLRGLTDEYRTSGPRGDEHNMPGEGGGSGGGAGGEEGGGGGSGGEVGGDGGSGGGGATPPADPVVDPLAGLGPMMGGGMDPLSALAPALGSLPGMMSSGMGGGGLPFDALGSALGSLGGLAGLKDNFSDKPPGDPEKPEDGFKDENPSENDDPKVKDPSEGFNDENHPDDPAHPQPVAHPTPTPGPAPDAAAPEAAPAGDAENSDLTVRAGDEVFTAPDKLTADVMRDVVEKGMSPTAAYGERGVQVAPPGTPVTSPVDPNLMKGGELGYFDAQEPILALGNRKIWLEGQVQPLSALGSRTDFLGWTPAPGAAARSGAAAV